MITYRLEYKNCGEIMFGIENLTNDEFFAKINKGLSKIKPWTHCVPFYKKAKFSFVSFGALKYFLFGICKFTYEDLKTLESYGFKVSKLDLEVYSTGMSKLFCTFFDDEIVESLEQDLSELFVDADSTKYRTINNVPVPQEDIKLCKANYYNGIKTYYA